MPVVRPIGGPGPLGLIIPPAPEEILPGHVGDTNGSTTGDTLGSTGTLSAFCSAAESAGAGALWAVDHLFWPRPTLECLTTLAVAATATRRTALGSCVLQLPLRRPAAVAKQAAALQLLSGGRFVLGVGVGSHPGEYEMAGVDFADRGALADAGIAALRRAWESAGDPGLPYRQEPAAPPVPVWVGGSSAAARRRAAGADGWVPMFLAAPDYARGLDALRAETAAAGRDPKQVTAAVVVVVRVGVRPDAARRGAEWLSALYSIPPRAFERHLVAGTAAACAEQLQGYFESGADHVAVMVAADHALDQFAELVGAFPATAGRAAVGHRPDLVEMGV